MKPTVRNIAERANVSIASVSLVLNNKPSRITEATRQKIIEAAKELGYNFEEKKKNEELSIENVCNNFEKKSIMYKPKIYKVTQEIMIKSFAKSCLL